jgi:hypothetical protein
MLILCFLNMNAFRDHIFTYINSNLNTITIFFTQFSAGAYDFKPHIGVNIRSVRVLFMLEKPASSQVRYRHVFSVLNFIKISIIRS